MEIPSDEDSRDEVTTQTDADGKSENGACKKFHETEMERFIRINKYFNPDSPTCKVDPSELGKIEALKWYGIIMQGSYGDNKSEAPSWFDLVDRLKWNSYESVKGM